MTSIAGFLASLAGGAPQEGQKATTVNATGTIGLFSALISATGTGQTIEGKTTGSTTLPGQTAGIASPDVQVETADGEAALGALLGEGLGLAEGAVEAAIVEGQLTGDAEAAIAVSPEVAATLAADGETGEASEGNETDEGQTTGAVLPVPDAVDVAGPDAGETQQTGGDGTQENTPAAAPQQAAAAVQAEADVKKASGADGPEQTGRQTGLENALNKASEKGQQNGLQNALNTAPRARGAGDAPQQAQPGQSGDAPRPGASDASVDPGEPIPPKHGKGRPEFAPSESKTIQRMVDAGNGKNQIRIHAGAENAGVTSPPTLTVNVAATAASPGPASPNTPHVPVSALAVHIAQQANNGARRFDISLDPPELGRIEVRLDVSREGKVMTHLVVERSDTLDLLHRDARHLERMLQDAGLNTSEDGIKFSLKDQGHARSGNDNPDAQDDSGTPAGDGEDDSASLAPDSPMPPPRMYTASTGLDIRI